MQTITTIRKRSTSVEFTDKDLEILENFLFDGLVRHLKDSKQFDDLDTKDDQYVMESRMVEERIRSMQRRITAAIGKIERDG